MDRLLGELRLNGDNINHNLDNRTNVDMNGQLWSPDEFVIRQRGRRRATDWSSSPSTNGNFLRTPTKLPPTSSMILRSSPRKRLTMGSTPESLASQQHSPMKTPLNAKVQLKWSDTPIQAKRPRLNDLEIKSIAQQSNDVPLEKLLRGYSQTQLIEIITGQLQDGQSDKKMREEQLRARLPTPLVDNFEQELQIAKRNIYKSLPTSRLCKKTDGAAFSRAQFFLTEFKRQIANHLQALQESCHWDALLDYILMAWPYVRSTPIWDNQSHNTIRRHCFKLLTSFCITAVKAAGLRLGPARLSELEKNFQDWAKDYEDVLLCISTLNKTLIRGRMSL